MEPAFWVLAFILFYLHGGYACLLAVASLFTGWAVPGRSRGSRGPHEPLPSVTVVIGARNEEAAIGAKLESLLGQDYAGRTDIVVASDCSTDGTDEIVRSYAVHGVKLVSARVRRGKAENFNAIVPSLDTDLVVFTDGTGHFTPRTIGRLVELMDDDAGVGLVGARLLYGNLAATEMSKCEGAYWSYETWLRALESRVWGTVIVSGDCYAIRRRLFRAIPSEMPDDFMSVLNVCDQGYRVKYDPSILVVDEVATTPSGLFRTKSRIVAGNVAALWHMRHLLNPLRDPLLAVKLLSHRLLRWLVAPIMAGLLVLNLGLLDRPGFGAVLAAQGIFYLLTLLAMRPSLRRYRLFSLPFYFCLVNTAACLGLWRFASGKVAGTWEPVRDLSR